MAIKFMSTAQPAFPNSRHTYQTAYYTSHKHLQLFLLKLNLSFSSCLRSEMLSSILLTKVRNFFIILDFSFYLNSYIPSVINLPIHLIRLTEHLLFFQHHLGADNTAPRSISGPVHAFMLLSFQYQAQY